MRRSLAAALPLHGLVSPLAQAALYHTSCLALLAALRCPFSSPCSYETMIVLRPTMADEERDQVRAAKAPSFGCVVAAACVAADARPPSAASHAGWSRGATPCDAACRRHHAFFCCFPLPQELAKFQAFLQKQGATQLSDMVRGRQRLAYPIKR